MRRNIYTVFVVVGFALHLAFPFNSFSQAAKTRVAIVGLDHDHVWELLRYIENEPEADLVGIADNHPDLVEKAKSHLPPTVKFYSDYVEMLDQARPEAVFVTTENDRHLEILRQCARRHIHYSTEKPMADNAAEAREMEQLAEKANIHLMVNYWNAWTASTHELFHRVKSGEVGAVTRISVEYGHEGPKEIGVSREFADWLYDPTKNGGGAIMDFGCYGAELALWLKGRPTRVFATTSTLKTDQHNRVDDDATIVLEYPDGSAIIQPSWDWPYTMDRTYVFGSKGSLLSTRDGLFVRLSSAKTVPTAINGEPVTLDSVPHESSNPIAYLLDRIRTNQPIEDPLSARLNVEVMEILDAARESARTGQASALR
jgi:predicted dehydrogenase